MQFNKGEKIRKQDHLLGHMFLFMVNLGIFLSIQPIYNNYNLTIPLLKWFKCLQILRLDQVYLYRIDLLRNIFAQNIIPLLKPI